MRFITLRGVEGILPLPVSYCLVFEEGFSGEQLYHKLAAKTHMSIFINFMLCTIKANSKQYEIHCTGYVNSCKVVRVTSQVPIIW